MSAEMKKWKKDTKHIYIHINKMGPGPFIHRINKTTGLLQAHNWVWDSETASGTDTWSDIGIITSYQKKKYLQPRKMMSNTLGKYYPTRHYEPRDDIVFQFVDQRSEYILSFRRPEKHVLRGNMWNPSSGADAVIKEIKDNNIGEPLSNESLYLSIKDPPISHKGYNKNWGEDYGAPNHTPDNNNQEHLTRNDEESHGIFSTPSKTTPKTGSKNYGKNPLEGNILPPSFQSIKNNEQARRHEFSRVTHQGFGGKPKKKPSKKLSKKKPSKKSKKSTTKKKSPKLHKGPLGGIYIIRKGKKIYQ